MSRSTITLSPSAPTLRPRAPRTTTPVPPSPGDTLGDQRTLMIGGAPVHLVDDRQARRVIAGAMHEDGPPLGVCSINLDHVHHFAQSDDRFDASGSVRWLNLIDGAPIATQVRRMTGVSYPRLAGSDIVAGILDDLAAAGLSLAVVGGSPEVTDELRRRLASGWPNLRFAGHWTPPREQITSQEGNERLCAELREAQANAVLVCLGKPRQERWIAAYGAQTGARTLLAFGAVVDFLAGRVSRAPHWVSAARAEWMWRLMLEPRRLARRYLIEGPPAYMAVRSSGSRPQ